jgi:hypothetical protein
MHGCLKCPIRQWTIDLVGEVKRRASLSRSPVTKQLDLTCLDSPCRRALLACDNISKVLPIKNIEEDTLTQSAHAKKDQK